MVGLIDDEKHVTTQWFKQEGDAIILVGDVACIGDPGYTLGGSRYLKVCHGLKVGPPPHVDLAKEIKVQNTVRDLIREGLVQSAHDCSEGGLAVAVAECCFNPEKLLGAEINVMRDCGSPQDESAEANLRDKEHRKRDACATLFNESQSRIVISVSPENLDKTLSLLGEREIPFQQLGRVGGDKLRIQIGDEALTWPTADLHDDWFNAIRRAVEEEESIPSL
jgi:phosphoribosylformylglycinamidine synthase